MPRYKRRRRSTYKRRSFRRRRVYRRRVPRRARIQTRRFPLLQPDRLKVKLRYSDFGRFTLSSGAASTNFTANDVNINGITGFDQYAALYRFYYVAGATMRMGIVNHASNDATMFYMFPATNTFVVGDLATKDPADYPYSKIRWLSPLSGAGSRTFIKMYMSTKKIYGKATGQAEEYAAAVSGAPEYLWYFNYGAQSENASATSFLTYHFTITFYVQFYGRQELAVGS